MNSYNFFLTAKNICNVIQKLTLISVEKKNLINVENLFFKI